MMVLISFQLHEEVFIYTFPQEVYTLANYCFHRRTVSSLFLRL